MPQFQNINESSRMAEPADISAGNHVFSDGAVRSIRFQATGTVYLSLMDDPTTFVEMRVTAGEERPWRVHTIRQTSTTLTTANDIIGLY